LEETSVRAKSAQTLNWHSSCTTTRRRALGILAGIIIGLLADADAKAPMPGKNPGGVIVTMLIGIAGGLLDRRLGKVIFGVGSIDGFFDLSAWPAAIVDCVILLRLYRLVTGNRHSHRRACPVDTICSRPMLRHVWTALCPVHRKEAVSVCGRVRGGPGNESRNKR
jgi:uncharacterized membrane protein YeaQ/YmgE (transglycosylase-associated protein family)